MNRSLLAKPKEPTKRRPYVKPQPIIPNVNIEEKVGADKLIPEDEAQRGMETARFLGREMPGNLFY